MPATPKRLEGMVAVSNNSDITPLGYVVWFSVPDESVGLRKLKSEFITRGIPKELLPKDVRSLDVFKRAMRAQDGRRREEGRIIETAVAPVTETPLDCVYQISTLVRDFDERIIEYPKALRVIFNKATEQVSYNRLGDVPRSETFQMSENIDRFIERNSSRVTGARVRAIVRNYIRDTTIEKQDQYGLAGENLRGKAGGVYFVAARYAEELNAVSEALEATYDGRAYLHAVPMADSASEREIIRRHHVSNTVEEMKELRGELRGLLQSDRERAPRSDVVRRQRRRVRALEQRAAEYASILADEQEDVTDGLKILRQQLLKLPDITDE